MTGILRKKGMARQQPAVSGASHKILRDTESADHDFHLPLCPSPESTGIMPDSSLGTGLFIEEKQLEFPAGEIQVHLTIPDSDRLP